MAVENVLGTTVKQVLATGTVLMGLQTAPAATVLVLDTTEPAVTTVIL